MDERDRRADVPTRIFRPGETPPPDDEWLRRPVEERIAGVWMLTKLCYAWNSSEEPRLDRSVTRIWRPMS